MSAIDETAEQGVKERSTTMSDRLLTHLPWIRVIASILAVLAGVLLLNLADGDAASAAAGLAVGFYGCLLTGASVLFAVTFSNGDRWPSVAQVARHTLLTEWIVLGGAATVTAAVGAALGWDRTWSAVMLILVVADIVGMISFRRLLRISSPTGRNRLLARELSAALRVGDAPGRQTLGQYLKTMDHALSEGRGRDADSLVDQLTQARADSLEWREAQFRVVRACIRATLLGGADPMLTCRSISTLVDASLSFNKCTDLNAVHLARTSRLFAWASNASLVMASQGSLPTATARQLIATALAGREKIKDRVDPDPRLGHADHLPSPVQGPDQALFWFRDYVSHQGSFTGTAAYVLFQHVTGDRYGGNYFDGAPVLGDLLDRNPGAFSGSPVRQEGEDWLAACAVEALATYRSPQWGHPPALVFPEFTSEETFLSAYLGVFAAIGGVDTPEQAAESMFRSLQPGRGRFLEFASRWDGAFSMGSASRLDNASHRLGSAAVLAGLRLAHGTQGDPAALAEFARTLGPLAGRAGDDAAARLRGSGTGTSEGSSGRGPLVEVSVLPQTLGNVA
jgi:hypothetical protein